MSSKSLVYLFMFIGSSIGGYIPTLFGVSLLSLIPVITSGIGGAIGVYIGYKLSKY